MKNYRFVIKSLITVFVAFFSISVSVNAAPKDGNNNDNFRNGAPFQILSEEIEANSVAIAGLNAETDQLRSEINGVTTAIEGLGTRITENEENIDDLQVEVNDLGDQIADLETATETQIQNLENELLDIQDSVNSNQEITTEALTVINLSMLYITSDILLLNNSIRTMQTQYEQLLAQVATTGSIRIGDENVVCDADIAGTIRYTESGFEGCHDNEWVSLGSPGSGDGDPGSGDGDPGSGDGDPGSGDVSYAIGDTGPAGGIVFYITNGGLSGLEAAPADQSSAVPWGCAGTDIPGADGTAVGTGAQNTADILAGCNELSAARIAHGYRLNGYSDWFLPSKNELRILKIREAEVGGFPKNSIFYWSSSELGRNGVWALYWPSSTWYFTVKGKYLVRVRAVRAF